MTTIDAGMQPLYDRLLVALEDEGAQSTKSGILLAPTRDPNAPKRGVVRRVGEGRLLPDGQILPLRVKPGDAVWFMARSAVILHDGAAAYALIREDDVLAKIPSP